MDSVQYDKAGKARMDRIYDQADPRTYFSTLSQLDYNIPEEGKPVFERLIEARRRKIGRRGLKLVDLGCSYGVNAALLKHGMSMAELYRLYTGAPTVGRGLLMARDRQIFRMPADRDLEVVGLDQAPNAVTYALECGALDAGFAADFERREPSEAESEALHGADLVISTGCFGYVTRTSLERILDAAGASRPWMAHFVLRMFDFEEAGQMLAERGYTTEKAEGLFRQRRFASAGEKARVLANLAERGIDPAGAEAEGWYHAELFVARPKADAWLLPLARLVEGMELAQ